jgi:hypothetical protein
MNKLKSALLDKKYKKAKLEMMHVMENPAVAKTISDLTKIAEAKGFTTVVKSWFAAAFIKNDMEVYVGFYDNGYKATFKRGNKVIFSDASLDVSKFKMVLEDWEKGGYMAPTPIVTGATNKQVSNSLTELDNFLTRFYMSKDSTSDIWSKTKNVAKNDYKKMTIFVAINNDKDNRLIVGIIPGNLKTFKPIYKDISRMDKACLYYRSYKDFKEFSKNFSDDDDCFTRMYKLMYV